MNTNDREDSLTLEILQTIEQKSDVTQRHLADRLGVALGLTNSYLKRCVRKGLVKIHQAPANRYLYYLTPKGFAEKSRLTAEYLSSSFALYRRAGNSFSSIYKVCQINNWNRILFCGVSELAEIASLRALDHDIQIVGIFDPHSTKQQFLHLLVWQYFDETVAHDVCLLTTLNDPGEFYDSLINKIDKNRILVPSIFGMNMQES